MTSVQTLEQFLSNPSHSGIYHIPETGLHALKEAASINDFSLLIADAGGSTELEDVLKRLGADLGFPDYFDPNLDAFDECINDFSWNAPVSGHILILRGLDEFRTENPRAFDQIIEILEEAIENWREEEQAFWVFIDIRANGLSPFPDMD